MELLELLTTIETNNVNEITFEYKDVKPLIEFIIEYNISYSTIDEGDNNLEKMKSLELDNYVLDKEDIERIEVEYNQIIKDFGKIANQEIYLQLFEIESDMINIRLS